VRARLNVNPKQYAWLKRPSQLPSNPEATQKMITLITCPKPFRGHSKIIQRNAIKSWTLLEPKPEILLMGDDEGTAEAAAEFGARHVRT
jgi:hypothetical protein